MKRNGQIGSTRAKLGRYAFFLGSAAALVARAGADTVGMFMFESGAGGSTTGATSGSFTADTGTGTAIGVHASATTVFSTPAGNGSARSFSSTSWVNGDYYQFTINQATYSNLAVSFDALSSGTGPKAFLLEYSTDGLSYSSVSAYTILVTVAGTAGGTATQSSFSTGASNPNFNYSFNLSGISALNSTTDYFRLVDNDTTTAVGGTSRVDNFLLTGTAGAGAVPEPSSVILLSVAGAGAVMAARRRKRA